MESPYSFKSSTSFPTSFLYAVTSSLDGTPVIPTPIVTQGKWAKEIN